MEQERRPSRHPITADRQLKRLAWSKEDNKQLFECKRKPGRRGYRRLLNLWKTHNTKNAFITEVTEQRLADQVHKIKDKWLETVEQYTTPRSNDT